MHARKTIFLLLFSTFWVVFSAIYIVAQAQDPYTISDIWINKKAKDATTARKKAIIEAESVAFNTLIKELVKQSDMFLLPEYTPEDISRMVKEYTVSDEAISTNSYKARFAISFNPRLIQESLEQEGIEVVSSKSDDTLVIPILQHGKNVMLWEAGNVWKDMWQEVAADSKVIPLLIPLGDLEDLSTLRVEEAFSEDYDAINTLIAKYNASNFLLAEAIYDVDSFSGKPVLQVILRTLKDGNIEQKRADYAANYGQNQKDFFRTAIKDVIAKMEEDWLQTQAMGGGINADGTKITTIVPIHNNRHWQSVKRQLKTLEMVERMDIIKLSVDHALIDLYYKKDLPTFSYFLNTNGFALSKAPDDERWVLRSNQGG